MVADSLELAVGRLLSSFHSLTPSHFSSSYFVTHSDNECTALEVVGPTCQSPRLSPRFYHLVDGGGDVTMRWVVHVADGTRLVWK